MAKYAVYGITSVTVCIEVEADNAEQAIEVAESEFGGLNSYCGNGGSDKLIGVSGHNESVNVDEYPEFSEVELIANEN